jgi:hypothetical protein
MTSLSDLPDDKVILAQVKEAARLNAQGVKTSRPQKRAKWPLKVPAYCTLLG